MSITSQFEKMGARIVVRTSEHWRVPETIFLDVRRDKDGEYFDVLVNRDKDVQIGVLNVDPEDRHLVLMAKSKDAHNHPIKQKFLCGHDERHWFAAAVPENRTVTTVEQAKQALKPDEVHTREKGLRLSRKDRQTRSNVAFKRQGEWFFVPAQMAIPAAQVLRNEPFFRSGARGAGKPHHAEEAYRTGGRVVYVNRRNNKVLTANEFAKQQARWAQMSSKQRESENVNGTWASMQEGATMYVRGRISHPDHSTIRLDGWHKVVMNTETESLAMKNVLFLD